MFHFRGIRWWAINLQVEQDKRVFVRKIGPLKIYLLQKPVVLRRNRFFLLVLIVNVLGLVPDVIFNPHGFPSRMTIAMMIELMAGKSAALHGLVHDATPFRFTEENTAIDYFGKLLEAGGYNYYGTERMYSGIDGREMTVQIFFGVVHYQRLRHMVSDKWQVRSTGPIDALTRQPVKGRKRGGGVRFGEMERDALISHGTSFLLQDRLFHCSDKTTVRC